MPDIPTRDDSREFGDEGGRWPVWRLALLLYVPVARGGRS